MNDTFDIAIIGGGIAGASLAYFLAGQRRVALLEREEHVGYHATGRSAAVFTPGYGAPLVQQLSRASADFLHSPPADFVSEPLLNKRGDLLIAGAEHADRLREYAAARSEAGAALRALDRDAACALLPLLRRDKLACAYFDSAVFDIDVNALHQAYLRGARARGLALFADRRLLSLAHTQNAWRLETSQGPLHAAILINAAGAWADEIAEIAGVARLGLLPKRRTAILLDLPAGLTPDGWPLTADTGIGFYIKPDAGKLLASPMDASPCEPCDARPDEMDIAICVDRVQTMLDLPVRRVFRAWAGLRSFLPDEAPVAGFDPARPDFFWLAGQGGFGIQTSPALGLAAAALLLDRPLPENLHMHGITKAALAPERLRHKRP